MKYFITFTQRSQYKNHYATVECDNWDAAHEFAKKHYAPDYSMVYAENQWHDYMGRSQAVRFNLKELK